MNKTPIKHLTIFVLILLSINIANSAQLIGVVIDNYDNLIVGANLDFKCDKNFKDINFPNITNSYGAFELDNIPKGDCRIFATFNNKVGYLDINIKEDKMYQEEIRLNMKKIDSNESNTFLIFITILIIITLLIIIFAYKKKKTRRKSIKKNKEIIVTKGMQDIILTLNEVEKKVIEFLINNEGSATQSKIRKHTHIPKTSLFRWINSLENKNLVKTEDFGNMKQVSFSDFFLKL